MLRSVTQTVAVLAVIHYMLTFTVVYFLTPGGGPNRATEVAATWFYKQSFQFMEFGYGAALAAIMAVDRAGAHPGTAPRDPRRGVVKEAAA